MAAVISAAAQGNPIVQRVSGAPNLLRVEGVDAESGIHYVRLTLQLGHSGKDNAPPHFTVECTELNGKRDLSWFVAFGGVAPASFTPPFRPTPEHRQRPKHPSQKLQMDFEGYKTWRPFTRVWEVLPSGELRYRNPGMHSPNMEGPRYFLAYLSSLPSLRIGYENAGGADAAEEVFPTQPLLDELAKTPLCRR
jgi:hypothetical protein